MKIAIRGHESRGKEVIQIFKDLGTEGLMDHTGSHIDWVYLRDDSLRPNQLIVGTDVAFLKGYNYKVYTLEEFENEFPFKIGDEIRDCSDDEVGIITDLIFIDNMLMYNVDFVNSGQAFMLTEQLKSHKEMKEERNITLTLEKAKEWYKKGGELKEIALQAFTEKELTNDLPKTWEEFCEKYRIKKDESYINSEGKILSFVTTSKRSWDHICPSKKSAEAHLAMMQLEQLRNCWWNGWEPNWNNGTQTKYCIIHYGEEFKISVLCETRYFLSFPTREMAEEFLECFRDLIEKAGDLI